MHNHYQQVGGEDGVFAAEEKLLRDRGHDVAAYRVDNRRIDAMPKLTVAARTVWSRDTERELGTLLHRYRPEVVHCHNTFPLISPSAYDVAHRYGAAVVQTLHNYRLLCPNAQLFRNGHVCEDCLGHRAVVWPSLVHACYRNSRPATAAVALMLAWHRRRRTWSEAVDMYIALSEFARRKFVEGGLPEDRLAINPNFPAADPGVGSRRGGYCLFVGRLSPEKGIATLLAAWQRLGAAMPLKIVGGGPLRDQVARRSEQIPAVELLGERGPDEVRTLMQNAAALVVPSLWYESFPMVIVEAFSAGLPVIASDLGSLSAILAGGRAGLLFRPGDPDDLTAKIRWARSHPRAMDELAGVSRREYETKYTAGHHYQRLLEIYRQAIARRRASSSCN